MSYTMCAKKNKRTIFNFESAYFFLRQKKKQMNIKSKIKIKIKIMRSIQPIYEMVDIDRR